MDTEKTFNSLDHKFILANLKKIGLGKNFVSPGLGYLLNNRESRVINGVNTTKCFSFKRSVRLGDPITDTFILHLEILFILIKNDPNIKRIEIFSVVTFIQLMQTTQLFS